MGQARLTFRSTAVAIVLAGAAIVVSGLWSVALAAPPLIEPGDYVITQESPAARRAARSHTAGSAIFVLKSSGKISTLAEPPRVSGPRGIREDKDGSFVFADAMGSAITRLLRDGRLETLFSGAPLTQPKDVAVDRDGGYVIADFAEFTSSARAQILKLSPDGKMSVLYSGEPLLWPHGIAVDAAGNYIVADHSCCVYRLAPTGKLELVARDGPLVAPQDVKIAADGSYIVTDIGLALDARSGLPDPSRSRPGKLLRIAPQGHVQVLARMPRARLRAVAPSNDGGLLVVEMMQSAIYRFSLDGGPPASLYEGKPLSQPSGIVQAH